MKGGVDGRGVLEDGVPTTTPTAVPAMATVDSVTANATLEVVVDKRPPRVPAEPASEPTLPYSSLAMPLLEKTKRVSIL